MLLGRAGRAATVAVTLLVAGACSSTTHQSSPGSTPGPTSSPSSGPAATAASGAPPIHWTACHDSFGPSGYQCATIEVPRNPKDPTQAGTIGLALDRRPASGQKIGSLLVNPGGPGASGVDFLPDAISIMPKSLLDRFDVVAFDPPGVARSAPVSCLGSAALEQYYNYDPSPTTPEGMAGYLAEDRTFAQGCQTRSGRELPYVSTADAAMDMDYIRAAVGDPKLSYLGFSYGTFLGATYAELYPGRVRAMVLDGATDPALTALQSEKEQAVSFEHDLQDALTACAAERSCAWKPAGDPMQAYEQLAERIRTSPLPVKDSTRTAGPSSFLYGTAVTLYDTSTWPDLYQMLAQASRGDGTDMLQLADSYEGRQPDGTYDNELESNAAVNCLDSPSPSLTDIEAALPAFQAAAPVFGPAVLDSQIQCTLWPVPASGQAGPIHADGSPPIVVVGSTGDPASPYRDAQALASELAHGVLLTRVGDGHTAYPYSTCIRNQVDSYLIQLTVPPVGTRCATDG
jgi:pimeloyl-ACP methyl ester carboxylesterase